ncbi:MAG: transposase [Tetrasphaera sp.]
MFTERTSLGLDVHARSVRAAAIDTRTGEVIERVVWPRTVDVVGFVTDLTRQHGPVLVTYEAGPTGYGLARGLLAAGHRTQVAAPSKLLRPSGERVKTDRRDAMLLARLARNDDIVAVTIPTPAQESARDLVRAREDVRAALMSARHQLSKLLLRHGYVYLQGKAWTGGHDRWLRRIGTHELGLTAWGHGPRSMMATPRSPSSWPAATGSMSRSWRWPRTASTPRSPDGWGACGGSRH